MHPRWRTNGARVGKRGLFGRCRALVVGHRRSDKPHRHLHVIEEVFPGCGCPQNSSDHPGQIQTRPHRQPDHILVIPKTILEPSRAHENAACAANKNRPSAHCPRSSRSNTVANVNTLADASESAAKNVLLARSALANACQYSTAADIAAARQALVEAKVSRLRADAEFLSAGLPVSRTQTILAADGDPEVTVSRENHRVLEESQLAACAEFLRTHPRQLDPEEDGWDRDTRKAWQALLDANTAAHKALGCARNAPCRGARG